MNKSRNRISSIPFRVKLISKWLIIPPWACPSIIGESLVSLNSINSAFNHPFRINLYLGGIGTFVNNQS